MKLRQLDKYKGMYSSFCFYGGGLSYHRQAMGWWEDHLDCETWMIGVKALTVLSALPIRQIIMLTLCNKCKKAYTKKFKHKFITKLTEKDIFYLQIT